MARYRRTPAVARTIVVAMLAAGVAVAVPSPAHAANGLTCRYTLFQWSGGFMAELAIVNQTTTTINGWNASWTFRNATLVAATWNGTITQSTPFDATARNAFYNGQIRPGAAAALGWTAMAPATEVPTDIVVNGVHCPVA